LPTRKPRVDRDLGRLHVAEFLGYCALSEVADPYRLDVDREDNTVATDRAREPGLEVARDAITNL